jgi:glyoxylase-like metal-dependent hydrolase (beta-lactamase superfamily II)
MHTKNIGQNLFLIDLQTGGFPNLIASYVLKGEKTLILETGPTSSIPNLLDGLAELQVKPEDVAYVAVTHIHVDHAGGVGTLIKRLPNAQIIVHPKGAPHLADPAKLWLVSQKTLGVVAEMFGKPDAVPKNRILAASDGEIFDLGGNLKLKAVEAPGHASHNMGFLETLNEAVFPGDGAGAYLREFGTVFPTTPPPFRPDIALISLDKLIGLNPKLLCYSHFGEAGDAPRRLREYQVQIRRWLMLVQEGLKQGESDEQIRERVLREDESIQRAVPTLRSNPIHRKTLIENSVQGFIEFAKNPQI